MNIITDWNTSSYLNISHKHFIGIMKMKTSECFRKIKNKFYYYTPIRQSAFLCFVAKQCLPPESALKIKSILGNLLDGRYTLERWLIEFYPHLDTSCKDMMNVTRLAWLDHLIEHYESIGD